jgi:FlaA1/EpsC-like NDP-sugar epimerase
MRRFSKKLVQFLINQNKFTKLLIVAITDSLIIFLSFVIFFVLPAILLTNFNQPLIFYFSQQYFFNFLLALATYICLMYLFRGFSEVQRSFMLNDLIRIIWALGIFALVLFTVNSVASTADYLLLLIQSISTSALALMAILISRLCFNYLVNLSALKPEKKVIIYGTGDSARELFSSLTFSRTQVVMFVTENSDFIGREIYNIPTNSWNKAKKLLESDKSILLYIASRSMHETRKKEIIEDCVSMGVKVKKISAYSDMLREQEVSLTDLSISDIVPRLNFSDESNYLEDLNNKSCMVTGAGGSIGSELARNLAKQKLKKLILVEISEPSLFIIQSELQETKMDTEIVCILADIKDEKKMSNIIEEFELDYVYHAAAYKHVPILEEKHNYEEAFRNNFLGTFQLAKLCVESEVSNFVFVSTDKAVRPTNLMGASKRLAEISIQSLSKSSSKTVLNSVRFGNVMDSSGSVLPTFRRQIKKGGPVTVTHPEIVRYFMTINEAAYLVVMSSLIAKNGMIYMLKMGEAVKIDDIAKRMIKLSGNNIKNDHEEGGIEVIYTGLRPGEKLYEELLVDIESKETTHEKIFFDPVLNSIELEEVDNIAVQIKDFLDKKSLPDIKKICENYADYRPSV